MTAYRHEIVDKGQVKGINYWIIEHEIGPIQASKLSEELVEQYPKVITHKWYCAYIEPPTNMVNNCDPERLDFQPHGDITYNDYKEDLNANVWGWDYNHLCDMEGHTTKLGKLGTKKAIEHIRKDVEDYVDQVLDFEKTLDDEQ